MKREVKASLREKKKILSLLSHQKGRPFFPNGENECRRSARSTSRTPHGAAA